MFTQLHPCPFKSNKFSWELGAFVAATITVSDAAETLVRPPGPPTAWGGWDQVKGPISGKPTSSFSVDELRRQLLQRGRPSALTPHEQHGEGKRSPRNARGGIEPFTSRKHVTESPCINLHRSLQLTDPRCPEDPIGQAAAWAEESRGLTILPGPAGEGCSCLKRRCARWRAHTLSLPARPDPSRHQGRGRARRMKPEQNNARSQTRGDTGTRCVFAVLLSRHSEAGSNGGDGGPWGSGAGPSRAGRTMLGRRLQPRRSLAPGRAAPGLGRHRWGRSNRAALGGQPRSRLAAGHALAALACKTPPWAPKAAGPACPPAPAQLSRPHQTDPSRLPDSSPTPKKPGRQLYSWSII